MSKNWWNFYLEAEEDANLPAPPNDSQPPEPDNHQQEPEQDIEQDPKHPDMPSHDEDKDFEDWRNDFFKLSIKDDAQEMIEACKKMTKRDLDATQKKFVADNLQIGFFRQDANIDKLSKAVRNLIRQNIDKNYPATTLMQHIVATLGEQPTNLDMFYKLPAFYGMKGDLHRKILAAILGAVQTGGGGGREDLVFNQKEYSVNVSTRVSTEWGEISLGKWAIQVDDPERFLEEPELARLKDGAPEEKNVLRHRIVLSSIAERFKTRAFLINVINTDGSIHCLAWDLADSLMSGYGDGKLVVRSKNSEAAEAIIDDDGNVIPVADLTVKYVKETGKHDDTGSPVRHEVDFMERIDGMLYLTADLETVREMSNMQGVFFHEIPFNGHPSDLVTLQACVPSLAETLLRRCG